MVTCSSRSPARDRAPAPPSVSGTMFRTIRHGRWLLEKLLQKQSTTREHQHCSNHRHPWLCSALMTPAGSSNESSGLPPPIRVALTDSAGRGTFATRRIGAGDLIHTADPIVSHPSISLLSNEFPSHLQQRQGPLGNFVDALFSAVRNAERKQRFWLSSV
ncbi:hypothetical protein ACLOJK_028625 [Asimina triloba]